MVKKTLLLIAIVASALAARAQDVVKWTYSAKKTRERTYEVHLLATLDVPWKIYSQHTPAGGPLPTKIKFDKNPLVILEGKVNEFGHQEKKFERAFDVDVLFYHGQVDFVQTVKLKTAVDTFISGSIEFMSCNETQCLPAATANFKVELK